MKPVSLFGFLLSVAALAGCGKSTPPTPTPGPVAPGERITGTERIGWDQQTSDSVELVSVRYVMYVDGARTELGDASCAAASGATVFACSARLPAMSAGAHRLELASYILDGTAVLESARSIALQVTVGSSTTTNSITSDWRGRVVTTTDHVRLRVDVVTGELDEPTDIAFTPDGRVLVAERAGRVRVVRDGRLVPDAAMELTNVATTGDQGLLAVAIDPEFDRTHAVYLLFTAASARGSTAFTVARFREAQDTLADPIVLIDEVPADGDRAAGSLRFGPDGKLYVAIDDGGESRRSADRASFNGKILRLNPNGTTPDDQAGATPVYAFDHRSPRGLDWNPVGGTLWIADDEGRGTTRLSVVADSHTSPKRATERTAHLFPQMAGVHSLAFYRGGRVPAFRGDLLVALDGGLLRLRVDPDPATRVASTERLLEGLEGIRAVAVSPDGTIYFCTAGELATLTPAR